MKPVVILDSNALYGRKPFTQANSTLLLALAEFGQVRLVVPEVVLLELSRQWAEEVEKTSEAAKAAVKKLNEALVDVSISPVALAPSRPDRTVYYDFAEELFRGKRAEIPPPPEVPVRDLLIKEIEVRKPFARQGTGFRDALHLGDHPRAVRGSRRPRDPSAARYQEQNRLLCQEGRAPP